jgi:hypothetical protein
VLTPAERRLRAQIAAKERWSRGGHAEHGAKIRAAKLRHYEDVVDPDRALTPAERARRAQSALEADMARLALRSIRARRGAS